MNNTKDQPRLIEVAFPLKQASLASVHEKNVRHGHISTLHIWPARRPLAACRAALLATLLPDPGDPEKRQELLEKIGGVVEKEEEEKKNGTGQTVLEEKEKLGGGVLAWGRENDPAMDELRAMIRDFYGEKAPKVLDPFAGGGAIPLEAMRLGCEVTASDLNPVAWFILKCTLEYPRQFAGKKWPLPDFVKEWPDFVEDFLAGKIKKRKGKKQTHFTDERQLLMLELPEADLAWQVRAWGRWVLERARADLASRYPTIDNEPTVAYLWARTARDKITMGRIPLLKTFWLSKKTGKRTALLPVPKEDGSGVTFVLLEEPDLRNTGKIINNYPFLEKWEITKDKFNAFLNGGTMNRAGVWSPVSGRPGLIALTMDDLRFQGQQGLLNAQMTAVVTEALAPKGKKTFKRYRLPTEEEVKSAEVEIEDLDEIFENIPFGLPDEPTPSGGGSGASRAFSIQKYGMKKWRDLFTSRQLLALGTFVKHTRRAIEEISCTKNGDSRTEAIAGALVIFFGRFVDYMSTLCLWEPRNGEVKHTFARYTLPITWDYVEANPLTISNRFYSGGVEVASRVFASLLQTSDKASKLPSVLCESSLKNKLVDQNLILTDPPYYDAIPYSDLMDFFFIWQKRILFDLNDEFQSIYSQNTTPKWDNAKQDGELIDDESRFGGDKEASKKAYENGMARAFENCCNGLTDEGRLVVVFANKEVNAWETLISALIRGGAIVTASWPIQTEMPNKVAQKRANLSSSVWIVCRKRPKTASFGWDARVLDQMKETLFSPRETLGGRNILQYFFDLGIRGPDFIWAALGPALEAYSAHTYVKKTEGGIMTVQDFLREVRRLVLHFSLGELPGFRDIQMETRGRGETVELDPVTQYYLLHRAYFGLKPAPAGACILYANACGKNETELKLVWNIIEQGGKTKRGRPSKDELDEEEMDSGETKGNEYRLLDWTERVTRESLGETRTGGPAPLIDRLHRLMYLLQKNRARDVQNAYEEWGLAGEQAFGPLLQAVREIAARDGQETERRMVEALAVQLKMNRRVVVEGNMIKDVPFFYGELENSA